MVQYSTSFKRQYMSSCVKYCPEIVICTVFVCLFWMGAVTGGKLRFATLDHKSRHSLHGNYFDLLNIFNVLYPGPLLWGGKTI